MASVPTVCTVRCRRCSKFRDPREFAGGTVDGVCFHCWEHHVEAILFLAGNLPRGCQECLKTIAELEALSQFRNRADTRVVLEIKDGIYQILCLDCDAVYQAKRRDLYARTPYGFAKGL